MFRNLGTQLTPDSEGAIVRFMIWLWGINWKSSTSAVASFLMGAFGLLTTFVAVMVLTYPQSGWAKAAGGITALLTLLSGLAKLWVGIISVDAGQVAIKLPDAVDPISVPAHEVPNVIPPAGAKIVKEP